MKEIIGHRFERLTVVSRGENSKSGHPRWNCLCECGNMALNVSRSNLVGGRTKSCGCYMKDSYTKRRKAEEFRRPLRVMRQRMIDRCTKKTNSGYCNYGSRGISVCKEWMGSIDSFVNWALKNGYNKNLEIDRIDNNGNYEPENCRFVDRITQANNKRNNVLITINGQTKTAAQWSRATGVNASTIRLRYKEGYTGMDLIDKPYAIRGKRSK